MTPPLRVTATAARHSHGHTHVPTRAGATRAAATDTPADIASARCVGCRRRACGVAGPSWRRGGPEQRGRGRRRGCTPRSAAADSDQAPRPSGRGSSRRRRRPRADSDGRRARAGGGDPPGDRRGTGRRLASTCQRTRRRDSDEGPAGGSARGRGQDRRRPEGRVAAAGTRSTRTGETPGARRGPAGGTGGGPALGHPDVARRGGRPPTADRPRGLGRGDTPGGQRRPRPDSRARTAAVTRGGPAATRPAGTRRMEGRGSTWPHEPVPATFSLRPLVFLGAREAWTRTDTYKCTRSCQQSITTSIVHQGPSLHRSPFRERPVFRLVLLGFFCRPLSLGFAPCALYSGFRNANLPSAGNAQSLLASHKVL